MLLPAQRKLSLCLGRVFSLTLFIDKIFAALCSATVTGKTHFKCNKNIYFMLVAIHTRAFL